MTKEEFYRCLAEMGLGNISVSYCDRTRGGHGIRRTDLGWETFVRERGVEYDVCLFAGEEEALASLLEEISALYRQN